MEIAVVHARDLGVHHPMMEQFGKDASHEVCRAVDQLVVLEFIILARVPRMNLHDELLQ